VSRILLIDDDVQVNEVIKATLEVLGHSVMAVDDPHDVQEAFSSFQPDVTLVDYMLPGCSGLEVIRELRRLNPHAIQYLATGLADFELLKRALDAGASSLLSKPYRVTDLVTLMDLAGLLSVALQAEESPHEENESVLRLECSSGTCDSAEVLRHIVTFALSHGADDAVAVRHLPMVTEALMKNACTHWVAADASGCTAEIRDTGDTFQVRVSNCGPGFDWRKAIARARSCMDKPYASGLQLVLALAQELHYEDDGRVACAAVSRTMRNTS